MKDSRGREKIAGVYRIDCLENGKFYVGSTVDLLARKWKHLTELRQGQHGNSYLQRAWNKYGESVFSWSIVEIVEDFSLLMEREQHWLDVTGCHQEDIGFNLCPLAYRTKDRRRKGPSRKPKPYLVTDPEGRETIVPNLAAFCRETDFGLDYPTMNRVSTGLWTHHKGWTCRLASMSLSDWQALIKSRARIPGDKKAKDYILIDPDGIEHRVRNLKQFCKARSFSPGTMTMVISGLRHHHHGWTCRRAE